MIIFPAIDIKGGKCVRLRQGDFDAVTTYGDDPVAMARKWRDEGAAWLHIVDLDGAKNGAPDAGNREIVGKIVRETGLPVQFGGGIRSMEAVEQMLETGVTRCVVGTPAIRTPDLAAEIISRFGERIAIGVDAKDGFVAVHGWQETSGERAPDFVRRWADRGAKRFIFTDIARDGMLQGVNVPALAEVAASVPDVFVIASGGVATIADLDALMELRGEVAEPVSNVEGVIVGKALYAGTVTLRDALARVTV